jgi:hypothetical protein
LLVQLLLVGLGRAELPRGELASAGLLDCCMLDNLRLDGLLELGIHDRDMYIRLSGNPRVGGERKVRRVRRKNEPVYK